MFTISSRQQKIEPKLFKSVISKQETKKLFNFLKENAGWFDTIKSRRVEIHDDKNIISQKLMNLLDSLAPYYNEFCEKNNMFGLGLMGIHLNLYRDGRDSTRTYSKQIQLIISLGQTRTLTIGKEEYKLEEGDVIIFGPSSYSVPRDDSVNERISIEALLVERITIRSRI